MRSYTAGMSRIDEVVQLFLKDAGRVYVHQDANYNVTTLTDITGRVLERSFYSPYGQLNAVISSHPFDYDDDGDVDADDASMIDADCSGDYSGDCRRLDADGDRDIDADDLDIIAAYIGGLSGDTALTRVPSSPRSLLGNPFAHQGLPLDAEIASYQNRARQYNPGLKRFMQRDPFGLGDGVNTYVYVRGTPTGRTDPQGLVSCTVACDFETFAPYEHARSICCDAFICDCRKVTCWRSALPPGTSDCAKHCLAVHEAVHQDKHYDCDSFGPICRIVPISPHSPGSNDTECEAYSAQRDCLDNCQFVGGLPTDYEMNFVKCMQCATCKTWYWRSDKNMPYHDKLRYCNTYAWAGTDGCS